jgi:exopolysaccharide production protein ExoQ
VPRQLALLAIVGLIGWLFVRDVRRRPDVSAASWLVVLWAVIFASRPVSGWFQGGAVVSSVDQYLEGSPVDRAVFLVLIAIGYVALLRRRIPLGEIVRKNAWLFVFYGFWAISVLWSDYPFVAFKRWFKDFGSVVMVLLLLTDRNPIETVKAVFVRSAYLLVPMSVLFVRFYPEIGRAYTGFSQNDLMYVGVATHKNTLGALLLVSCIFLIWDLVDRRQGTAAGTGRLDRADSFVVLLMAIWLLLIADSATAMLCTVGGAVLFMATRIDLVRRRLRHVELYVLLGIVGWYILDSVFHVSELLVSSVGRDMTLTTRTDAWELFFQLDINPIVGAGFKSFWAGDRMTEIWRDFPGIVQAHNGYIETYLEGGLLGLLVLAALLVAGFRKIKRGLLAGDRFAGVRLTFWAITLFYNFSEAAFTQLSLLWIVTLLVIMEAPPMASAAAESTVTAPVLAAAGRERWRRPGRALPPAPAMRQGAADTGESRRAAVRKPGAAIPSRRR